VTVVSAAVIALVVWAIGLIGPTRWRAVVYALPIPVTVVLASTDLGVDARTLIGIAGLCSFIVVVTVLHDGFGWPVLLADAGGAVLYVLTGGLVARLPELPFWPVLAGLLAVWALTATAVLRYPGVARPVPVVESSVRGSLLKLLGVFAAALAMVALGGFLRGLVVTFPYSGVLVVLDARDRLRSFTRHFLLASPGLLLFLAGFHLGEPHGRVTGIAAGWVASLACAAALQPLNRLLSGREASVAIMSNATNSPRIIDVSWGRMQVEGLDEGKDFVLLPGGGHPWDWRVTGMDHEPGIGPAEVRELIDAGPAAVVLSRGMEGRLQVQDGAVEALEKAGIAVHVALTPEAVRIYNELAGAGPVAGLFHSTC
jgi:hypothetical protein